jgi:hypothetical protein
MMYTIQATYTPDPDAVGGRIIKGELRPPSDVFPCGEYIWRLKGVIVDFCPWTGKELVRSGEDVYAAAEADKCWLQEKRATERANAESEELTRYMEGRGYSRKVDWLKE